MSAEGTVAIISSSISLLDNLYSLIKNAKEKGGPRLTTAQIVNLPAEASSLAKQISAQLIALDEELKKSGVDMGLAIGELDCHYDWWKQKRWRASRMALPVVDGLQNALVVLVDDFVAVTSCAGADELLAQGFSDSRKQKARVRELASPERPVGEALKDLINYTEDLAAKLGDL